MRGGDNVAEYRPETFLFITLHEIINIDAYEALSQIHTGENGTAVRHGNSASRGSDGPAGTASDCRRGGKAMVFRTFRDRHARRGDTDVPPVCTSRSQTAKGGRTPARRQRAETHTRQHQALQDQAGQHYTDVGRAAVAKELASQVQGTERDAGKVSASFLCQQ